MIAAAAVYIIINVQRRTTANQRNDQNAAIIAEIELLKRQFNSCLDDIVELQNNQHASAIDRELLNKDIEYLKQENTIVKQDLKDIKQTLSVMALSLERIAAKYDYVNGDNK